MTREDRVNKLKHYITCLKCEVSGKCCDDNCSIQYEAGNLGEIIENLEAILKVLEQELCDDAISRQAVIDEAFEVDTKEYGRIEVVGVDAINSLPPVTPHQNIGCEGCIYEKTGTNSTYPCSHCGRCYTDKYKSEGSER